MANHNAPARWTSQQAYAIAFVCLLLGLAIGYLARRSSAAGAPLAATPAVEQPLLNPEELAALANKEVQPLLQELKATPDDPALLRRIGDTYADRRQYVEAVKFYKPALKLRPADLEVRGDLAACYWYTGNAEAAIAEYELVLEQNPAHPATLYNMGMIRWESKRDYDGAVQAWERLLAANPNFPRKAQVQEFIAQAKQHSQGKQGMLPR